MQQDKKIEQFNIAVGKLIKKIRSEKVKASISKFAQEYDLDRGNFSRIERGFCCCRLSTAWKISEAAGMKFSDFAKLLEKELGEKFKLIDE